MVLRHAIIATELELIPEMASKQMIGCNRVGNFREVTHRCGKAMQHASSRHHYSSNHHSSQSPAVSYVIGPVRILPPSPSCEEEWVLPYPLLYPGRAVSGKQRRRPYPGHSCRHLHNHMALNTQAFVSSAHVDINGCRLLSSNGVRP